MTSFISIDLVKTNRKTDEYRKVLQNRKTEGEEA